jgi:hypothetical protein
MYSNSTRKQIGEKINKYFIILGCILAFGLKSSFFFFWKKITRKKFSNQREMHMDARAGLHFKTIHLHVYLTISVVSKKGSGGLIAYYTSTLIHPWKGPVICHLNVRSALCQVLGEIGLLILENNNFIRRQCLWIILLYSLLAEGRRRDPLNECQFHLPIVALCQICLNLVK